MKDGGRTKPQLGKKTNSSLFISPTSNPSSNPFPSHPLHPSYQTMSLPTNWDDFEKLVHHTLYNELRVAPEETPTTLLIPPNTPNHVKDKLVQIAFETFSIPCLSLFPSSSAVAFTTGRMDALVVEFGRATVTITPVFDGCVVAEAITSLSVGGEDITDYTMKLLTEQGYSFTTTAEREIVRDIKEKLGYTALDFAAELETCGGPGGSECSYELPDGQVISVGSARFRGPELLFRPALVGSESLSLQDALLLAVMGLEPELRRTMLANIVLAGGPALTPRLGERLTLELQVLLPESVPVKVFTSPEAKYSGWIGGSIVTFLGSAINQGVITSDMYNEMGPRAHRRRFYW